MPEQSLAVDLEGARALNTTILLKESTETIIPVSCTEQGRWAYVSKEENGSYSFLLISI